MQKNDDLGYLIWNSTRWSCRLEGQSEPENIYGVHHYYYDILIEAIDGWLKQT